MDGAARKLNLKRVLTREERAAINALLDTPNSATWAQARQVVVALRPEPLTLLDAVEAVSLFGFRTVPDPFTLRRALRFASSATA